MAELGIKQRQRLLGFAEKIAQLAQEAPDRTTKRELYAARNSILKRFGFSDQEKREAILGRILDGAATIADIIAETNFHKDDVHMITKDFEASGIVVFRSINSGERGRPKICIFIHPNYSPQKLN